jgi:hypothetical protein
MTSSIFHPSEQPARPSQKRRIGSPWPPCKVLTRIADALDLATAFIGAALAGLCPFPARKWARDLAVAFEMRSRAPTARLRAPGPIAA